MSTADIDLDALPPHTLVAESGQVSLSQDPQAPVSPSTPRPTPNRVRRRWTSQNIAWMIPTVRARCGSERSARWATASSTRASAPVSGR